ncbi:unnamed protein product [Nezara viridula]|uniref:Uncharacterized protein n=1 Tax=Nezara viridula TaxID=85310 RepID=A0A9P0HS47_NEZVI|nr:unnamed protein product [Nezara viridula]
MFSLSSTKLEEVPLYQIKLINLKRNYWTFLIHSWSQFHLNMILHQIIHPQQAKQLKKIVKLN